MSRRREETADCPVCPWCGKAFYMGVSAEEWGWTSRLYLRGGHVAALCSYSCLRAYEAPRLERQRAKMAREFALAAAGTSTIEMQCGYGRGKYIALAEGLLEASTVTK